MKVLVAYDGTLQAKEALRFGLMKAKEAGTRLMVLNVFNDNMFIDYDAMPSAVDMARAQSKKYLEEAKAIVREEGRGVHARVFTTEGSPDEAVLDFAKAEDVDVVVCPPKYRSIIKRFKAVLEEQGKASAESVLFGDSVKGGVSVLGVKTA